MEKQEIKKIIELYHKIVQWGDDRNFFDTENGVTLEKQQLKFLEKLGELSGSLLRLKHKDVKDAIGDLFVVSIMLLQII